MGNGLFSPGPGTKPSKKFETPGLSVGWLYEKTEETKKNEKKADSRIARYVFFIKSLLFGIKMISLLFTSCCIALIGLYVKFKQALYVVEGVPVGFGGWELGI